MSAEGETLKSTASRGRFPPAVFTAVPSIPAVLRGCPGVHSFSEPDSRLEPQVPASLRSSAVQHLNPTSLVLLKPDFTGQRAQEFTQVYAIVCICVCVYVCALVTSKSNIGAVLTAELSRCFNKECDRDAINVNSQPRNMYFC